MAPYEVRYFKKFRRRQKHWMEFARTEAFLGPSITSRMTSGSLQMTDVLREKAALIACKKSNREISRFVASNITELIHEAIFGTSRETNDAAMKIISFNNRLILSAICDSDELQTAARAVLEENEPDPRCVGNLCNAIEHCLNLYPEAIETSFSFVLDMVCLVDQPDVLALLDSLLTWKAHPLVIEFMREKSIVEILISKITEGWEELDEWKIIGMYKLLITCVSNIESFENECYSPRTIAFAIDYLSSDRDNIESVQWKFLKTLINRDTVKSFAKAGERAIIAATADGGTESRVEAINFLCHLYELDTDAVRMYDNVSLIKAFTRLFLKYSTHTIYMFAISQFLITSLEIPEMRSLVLDYYFPEVLDVVARNENRTQIAYILELGRQLKDMMKHDRELQEEVMANAYLCDFIGTKVTESEKILNREYGKLTGFALPVAHRELTQHEMFPLEV